MHIKSKSIGGRRMKYLEQIQNCIFCTPTEICDYCLEMLGEEE